MLQVKILQEEKMTLLSEISRLTAAREAAAGDALGDGDIDDAGASLGPAHAGTLRYSNMRAQLDALKDEVDKVELQRDDQRARADVLEREVALLKLRNEELQVIFRIMNTCAIDHSLIFGSMISSLDSSKPRVQLELF